MLSWYKSSILIEVRIYKRLTESYSFDIMLIFCKYSFKLFYKNSKTSCLSFIIMHSVLIFIENPPIYSLLINICYLARGIFLRSLSFSYSIIISSVIVLKKSSLNILIFYKLRRFFFSSYYVFDTKIWYRF